jgi:hypothetical protein
VKKWNTTEWKGGSYFSRYLLSTSSIFEPFVLLLKLVPATWLVSTSINSILVVSFLFPFLYIPQLEFLSDVSHSHRSGISDAYAIVLSFMLDWSLIYI